MLIGNPYLLIFYLGTFYQFIRLCKSRNFLAAICISFLYYSSCIDDDAENNNCQMGQMSATIDGNDWTAVSFNNTIVKADEDGVEV